MTTRTLPRFIGALGVAALLLTGGGCDDGKDSCEKQLQSAKAKLAQGSRCGQGAKVARSTPVARVAAVSNQRLAKRAVKRPLKRVVMPAPGDRDPFARPGLDKPPITRLRCEGHVALREHGLGELELTAVVSGDSTRALAMLRVKGGGKTATVKRGQRIGKGCLRVKSIHTDRVVLEVQRTVDASDQRADHVIPLRPSRKHRS